MARCPSCSGLLRASSSLRCPYCGVALSAGETRTAATETLTRTPDALPDLDDPSLPTSGEARFAPGRVFASRFRIVSLLGRGAIGEVYRADDLRLGQPVALKLLTTLGSKPNDSLARFAAEVRLARTIAHPNVCRVFDIGEAEGWHYLSMEYVDGETLASLRERIGRLPPEKATDVARQLCAGLAAAHEHGVLHRDLKPANIMLDGRGRVRIMDFGLAVQAGDRADRIAGTPAYIAPEQLVGKGPTERSDLFSLGLVLYEIVTGSRAIRASTFAQRAATPFDPRTLSYPAETDSRVTGTIRQCLAADPAERPGGAMHVAARLPGGDAIAAALAEGRVPMPDIVASTPAGALAPALAVSALGLIIAGVGLVGLRGEILTVGPADVPKPPEVLAERSRQLLASIGQDSNAADQAYWFESVEDANKARTVRFVYRNSPQPLKPFNLLSLVTSADPPENLPGMATVTVDASGRLLRFFRIVTNREPSGREPVWANVFQEANLDLGSFDRSSTERGPLVPHDDVVAWVARRPDTQPPRVTAATLAGVPVAFDADPAAVVQQQNRNVISTRRSRLSEAMLWVFVIVIFSTAVMVRRHLRGGEADLHGARTLAMVVTLVGLLSIVLQAHHVSDPLQELLALLSGTGWALLWAGFSWLAYLAFEPHVRRLWPRTLIAWTRVLSGRWRDPLVGSNLLLGILIGTGLAVTTLLIIMTNERGPSDASLAPALDSLRSSRVFASRLLFLVLDSMQFALGGLFMLALLRMLVGRTWLVVIGLIMLNVPLSAWSWTPVAVLYAMATAVLFAVVVLRLGLLAAVAMLASERVLTSLPITLDFSAWYVATSGLTLALVLATALWAFRLSLLRGGAAIAAT